MLTPRLAITTIKTDRLSVTLFILIEKQKMDRSKHFQNFQYSSYRFLTAWSTFSAGLVPALVSEMIHRKRKIVLNCTRRFS